MCRPSCCRGRDRLCRRSKAQGPLAQSPAAGLGSRRHPPGRVTKKECRALGWRVEDRCAFLSSEVEFRSHIFKLIHCICCLHILVRPSPLRSCRTLPSPLRGSWVCCFLWDVAYEQGRARSEEATGEHLGQSLPGRGDGEWGGAALGTQRTHREARSWAPSGGGGTGGRVGACCRHSVGAASSPAAPLGPIIAPCLSQSGYLRVSC